MPDVPYQYSSRQRLGRLRRELGPEQEQAAPPAPELPPTPTPSPQPFNPRPVATQDQPSVFGRLGSALSNLPAIRGALDTRDFIREDIDRGGPFGTLAQFGGASLGGFFEAGDIAGGFLGALGSTINPINIDVESRRRQIQQNPETAPRSPFRPPAELGEEFRELPFGEQLFLGAAAEGLGFGLARSTARGASRALQAIEPPILELGNATVRPSVTAAVDIAEDGASFVRWAPNNPLDLRPHQVGLNRAQRIENSARQLLRQQPRHELAQSAFEELQRNRLSADNLASRLGAIANQVVDQKFFFDSNGGIPSLAGIVDDVPGPPTIQDVAARLPLYRDKLTGEQIAAINRLADELEPFHQLRIGLGDDIRTRPDVMDGGRYIHRGRAGLEGADEPIGLRTRRRGTTPGSDRTTVFNSMAEGISQGYEYAPLNEALETYVRENGRRAAEQHLANFFKLRRGESGELIGETPKMRLFRQNPDLKKEHDSIVKNITRLRSLKARLDVREGNAVDRFILDPDFDDIDALRDALRLRVQRGRNRGAGIGEVETLLRKVQSDLRKLSPKWKMALRRAREVPRGQATISTPLLANRTFPDEIANSMNKLLNDPSLMRGHPLLDVVNASNILYRGIRSTLDWSALGIQGLVGLANDPRAFGQAMRLSARSWGPGGKESLGKFILQFDRAAQSKGTISSAEWGASGLRLGGVDTEFMVGQGITRFLSDVPGIQQANRAFGFFGDTLRLQWADDVLHSEIARGRTLQQIIDSGDLERIAKTVNGATGWSQNRTLGSLGDLLFFAPRFLQSRLETITRVAAGFRPGATMDQRLARRFMLRFLGSGVVLTYAINELLGNDTDHRPIVAGRPNPNFLRIRALNRDWSVFGPWDSLLRSTMAVATGSPLDAVRPLTSGIVSNAWDFIAGQNLIGEPTPSTPEEIIEFILKGFSPFSFSELPDVVDQFQEGHPTAGTATIIAEIVGAKSSPVTPTEIRDMLRSAELEDRGITETDWRNVDLTVRDEINNLPHMKEIQQRVAERQRQLQSEYRAYADERDELNSLYDGLVGDLARTVGPSREFREVLRQHQRERSIKLDQLRANNSEALEFFANQEPSTSVFNQAVEMYRSVTARPDLENPVTLEYDFQKRDQLLSEEFRKLYPGELDIQVRIDAVRDFIRRNDHPLVKELHEARETLRPYWEINQQMTRFLPLQFQKGAWQEWLDEPDPIRKRAIEQRYGVMITNLIRQRDEARQFMRQTNPEIERLLIRWGYGITSPVSLGGTLEAIQRAQPAGVR